MLVPKVGSRLPSCASSKSRGNKERRNGTSSATRFEATTLFVTIPLRTRISALRVHVSSGHSCGGARRARQDKRELSVFAA